VEEVPQPRLEHPFGNALDPKAPAARAAEYRTGRFAHRQRAFGVKTPKNAPEPENPAGCRRINLAKSRRFSGRRVTAA
jgi:hypothetical protein